MDKLEHCRRLQKYLLRKLQEGKFRRAGEVLKLTLGEHLECGGKEHLLKTCLICTKSFIDNDWIKEPRAKIVKALYPAGGYTEREGE